MIKVIKHGYKEVICPHCKALLQYEDEDVETSSISNANSSSLYVSAIYNYIVCPDCKKEIRLGSVPRTFTQTYL